MSKIVEKKKCTSIAVIIYEELSIIQESGVFRGNKKQTNGSVKAVYGTIFTGSIEMYH